MRWLGLLPLVVACSHPKTQPAKPAPPPVAMPAPAPTPPPPPPKAPPRLFSEAEISTLEADVLARLAANGKRTCPGPNGTVAGASGPDIIAIVEGTGPTGGCMTRLADAGKDGGLKGDIDARKPAILELDKDCAELFATAVHHASAFQDGCSPYQLGVRVEPVRLMGPIQLAHLLGFHAHEAKDPAAALAVLVDAMRVLQDLERGHVTLISAMISVASSEIIGARMDAILETAKLSKAKLDELAASLDHLLAAVPSFNDILAGEREAQELYFGLARLEPKDWTPPGGWNEELRHLGDDSGAKHVADPRDEAMAVLAAAEQGAVARDKACPPGATLEACRLGLDQLGNAKQPEPLDTAALWKQGQTDEPAMRLKMRQQIVDILATVAAPNYSAYVGKEMAASARLAELRMHVEVLRTHKCDIGKLGALAPASLGAPLKLALDKKTLEVTAPGGTKPWTLHCR